MDFKFCTVVWYHKIQIKFEFQCDQIIGSKVVIVPSAKLEINVDVKYVGEDERTDGLKGELARFGGNGKEVNISGNG
jgi:hypothetical protein